MLLDWWAWFVWMPLIFFSNSSIFFCTFWAWICDSFCIFKRFPIIPLKRNFLFVVCAIFVNSFVNKCGVVITSIQEFFYQKTKHLQQSIFISFGNSPRQNSTFWGTPSKTKLNTSLSRWLISKIICATLNFQQRVWVFSNVCTKMRKLAC